MSRPLVVHVVGARPNYMKVAPVYAELERRGRVDQRLVHTGQHYDALLKDVFFAELPLPRPHVELEIGSGSHGEQTGRALIELEQVFLELRPDLVVVAGDVNSTLAGALAAVKVGVRVCHIEESANQNLVREGIPEEQIEFVGNTMIDTLLANVDAARALETWREFGLEPRGYILVTLHRQRLFDVPDLLGRAIEALEVVADSLPVIFPVHPRTQRALEAEGLTGGTRVILTPPLPYRAFLSLEADAAAVITDSGGVPEETTVLGVPCYTLRRTTERPVTVELGTNTILGQDPEALRDVPALLTEPRPAQIPPLWDGRAGERAADAVERLFSLVEVPA